MKATQAHLIDCDDKPYGAEKLTKTNLEEELEHAYCHKCLSPELKITKIIQIECKNCGRKRLMTIKSVKSKR
ncbi:MAG: hypothetical protein QXN37_00940 [Candidatus Anstonellaceae archaeon]